MANEQRRGLGRGLSALIEEAEQRPAPSGAGVREIPIDLVHRNPDQPRFDFQEGALTELAASMRERGVLQPILVRPKPGEAGQFQIVAGERRWRAAQRAGLATIPALVRELDDRETLEIALVENVQRADLSAIEEAIAYQMLVAVNGRTQEQIAETVGKSRPHVANVLRLLQLPPPVQTLIVAKKLTAGHARALIGTKDPEGLARRIVAEGLNVRQAEALAKRSHIAKAAPAAPKPKAADTLALERDLSEALGLSVQVSDSGGKGELRIKYKTFEQLDAVCRKLTRG
ncbi:MAG: ParB/RepB/Spo0J family partition protein [Caulobacteraceae bacterium]